MKVERNYSIKCEKCEQMLDIRREDLTLERACPGYKLFSFVCPCCHKKDYIRDKDLKFET